MPENMTVRLACHSVKTAELAHTVYFQAKKRQAGIGELPIRTRAHDRFSLALAFGRGLIVDASKNSPKLTM